MKLIMTTAALILTAGATFAEDATVEMNDFAKPEIAFVEAATIAAQSASGDLLALELDYTDDGEAVYLADLESDTGFSRLMIDGDTGAVLVTETIDAANEDALDAYMTSFGTHAELQAMTEMASMFEALEDLDELELELGGDDLPEDHDQTGDE